MIQINLIPDVKRDLLRAQAVRNFVIFVSMIAGIISIAVVVIASATFGGMLVLTGINENNIKTKFDELSKTRDLNETIIVQSQLNEISNIRKASPNTSRILRQILTAIQTTGSNEVSFSSVKYDPATRNLTIEGQSLIGFSALEGFKKTIQDSKIFYREQGKAKGVSCTVDEATNGKNDCLMTSLVADDGEVITKESSMAKNDAGQDVLRFSVNFVLNKVALSFKTKDFAVKSPAKKEVTDSKTIISDDVFTVKASDEGEKNGR